MTWATLLMKASAEEAGNSGLDGARRSPADLSRQERELESSPCYRLGCVAVAAHVPAVASLPQRRAKFSQLDTSVPTNKRQPDRPAKARATEREAGPVRSVRDLGSNRASAQFGFVRYFLLFGGLPARARSEEARRLLSDPGINSIQLATTAQ